MAKKRNRTATFDAKELAERCKNSTPEDTAKEFGCSISTCGKTAKEWAEALARTALTLFNLKRSINECLREIDMGLLDEIQIERRLQAALKRSEISDEA